MVLVALMMTVLLGFAALSVDMGVIMASRTQLQASADAAARAGIQELRDSGNPANARQEATTYARANAAFQRPVELAPSDVQVGHYDYASRTFNPGLGFGAPAVRVVARATEGSPMGPIPLVFSQLIGRGSADVTAEAVASVQRRDVAICQDRTFSFLNEFGFAQEADRALLSQMHQQGLSGDRVGLVSFARDTTDEQAMTELSGGGTRDVRDAIDRMEACTSGGDPGGPCYGTDIGAGLDACRRMLEDASTGGDSERVIILVSDGVPCFAELLPSDAAVTEAQEAAVRAADRAADAGMNIFSITLFQGGTGTCFEADIGFNESLARGFGRGLTTTEPEDLDDLLTLILTQMPVYLVQ